MTVWIVIAGDYYPGVFSSREKAHACAKRWREYALDSRPQVAPLRLDEDVLAKYDPQS